MDYSFPTDAHWAAANDAQFTEPYILVVDPATRKLCIPLRAVAHTQALLRIDRVPSICMLYLQGRCRQGPACHQLHADPHVIDMLRSEVSLRTSCCPEHGEEVTQPSLIDLSPEVEYLLVDGYRVAAARVATTNGMRRMALERRTASDNGHNVAPELAVPRTQICRLHVQGRCRYAEDCNFVHICRALTDGEDPELSRMLSSVANTATPTRSGRASAAFSRSAGTPASAFVPPMPPSPLYAAAPRTPLMSAEHFALEHDNSHETTPPSTPALNGSLSTPLHGPWRHEPYSWHCVSPVRQG